MPTSVHDILDMTVPTEFRDAVAFTEIPVRDDKAQATTEAEASAQPQTSDELESPMPAENTPNAPVQTIDIKAIAKQAAQDLLQERDNQLAIANKIEGLLADKAKAEASAAKIQGELDTLKAQVKTLSDEVETQKAEAAKQKKAADDAEKDKKDALAKFKKAKADLDAVNTDKTIASRIEALTKAGLLNDARKAKAVATVAEGDNAGTLAMSDEAFAGWVAELSEAFTAGKASAPAPQQGDAGEKKNEPAPQQQQQEQKKEEGEQTTQAQASALPAAPDLGSADTMVQGIAAMLAGQATSPSQQGVNSYASAFGSAG